MTRFVTHAKKPNISQNDLTIIIPCAGIRSRMRSHGAVSLTILSFGMTLLEHQLKIIYSVFPQSDIIVVAGFQEAKIRKMLEKSNNNNVRLIVNENYADTNVVKSIGLGLRSCITKNAIICYGDLVYNRFAIENLPNEKCSRLVVTPPDYQNKEQIGMTSNNQMIKNLAFGLYPKWAQIGLFTGRELDLLQKVCYSCNNDKLLGYEAINRIINRGGKFQKFTPCKMKVAEIDSLKDIPQAIEISKLS